MTRQVSRRIAWISGLASRVALGTMICLALCLPAAVHGALLTRSITVDGDMTDWKAMPDITTNAGQFSEDCEQGQSCELDAVGSTGRDLKQFSFTWDNDYLYFYVERYASTNNTTNWLFYLDEDADGLMESNERIFRVDWQGSNQSTDAYLCPYIPDDSINGDPVDNNGTGDGHTLPGASSNSACAASYSKVTGGAPTGLEMESRVSWAQLGLTGPQNVQFHISSSTGMNLPSQVIDNMNGTGGDGDGGGELFPPDVAVTIGAAAPEIHAHQTMTFDVTVANVLYDDFTDLVIDLGLPIQMQYQSHTAPPGTSLVDSDSDGVPDQWLVPLLAAESALTLQLDALALPVSLPINGTTTATLSAWATAEDSDPANNTAGAVVQVLPVPELSVTRLSSAAAADPGDTLSLTSSVTNASFAIGKNVVLTETLGHFAALRLDTYGPGQHVQFSDGASLSGLVLQTVEFSADGGSDWSYVPTSGGGGAPAGHDGNVTHFRAIMNGDMNAGGNFALHYEIRVE